MRYVGAAVFALLVGGYPAVSLADGQSAAVGASAEVRDGGGRLVASVTFRETPDQVLISLSFPDRSLTGSHGVQIHETGRCDPPDFATAGGIFNPFGKQHGLLNPDGPMVGDLANLVISPSGLGSYNTAAQLAKLGPGSSSLLKPGGTSLVILAQGDDQRSQPEGDGGARIACGVIVQGPGATSIVQGAQSTATDSDGRPSTFGAMLIALGGIALIGVGVALRQHRLQL